MSFSILPKQSQALYFLEWPLSFTGDICKWGSACVHHAANQLISIRTGWHTRFVSRKRLVCSRWKSVCIRSTVQELVLLPLQGCQPDGGSGGMLSSTWQLEVQLCVLRLEGKIGKTIHKLVCFDSEMLLLGFGLRCQGKSAPDLCAKQLMVAVPELWSSWTSLQALRDVEDSASNWAVPVLSQPGHFLHHHHGFFCQCCSCNVEETVLPSQNKRSD